MSNLALAVFLAALSLAGTLVTGYRAWRKDRRHNSGSIRTSTAEDLWDESSDFRKALAEELNACRAESERLRRTAEDLSARVGVLEDEARQDRRRIADLERDLRLAKGA